METATPAGFPKYTNLSDLPGLKRPHVEISCLKNNLCGRILVDDSPKDTEKKGQE